MTLLFLSIPLMIFGVAIATVPLVFAMRRQHHWEHEAVAEVQPTFTSPWHSTTPLDLQLLTPARTPARRRTTATASDRPSPSRGVAFVQ